VHPSPSSFSSKTITQIIVLLGILVTLPSTASICAAAEEERPIQWLADYADARNVADQQDRMLLIFFRGDDNDALSNRFKAETLDSPSLREKLSECVCVELSLDTKISSDDKEIRLLDHSSFQEMRSKPGVAIIDFKHSEPEYHGNVVSIFPLTERLWYSPEKMAVILDLPRGTLTQRTMIFAVRSHPEKPASTDDGDPNAYLLEEAKSQAEYQARTGVQGHQQWESRFQRIVSRLHGGAPREICAESWPGQNLIEAALECVHSWRTSSGHWSAVRTRTRFFAYDIKRGNNGVWYATGIVSSP
jgi:hypothetical protein